MSVSKRRRGRAARLPGPRALRPRPLTRREREIVLAILDGCTNAEMARRFHVAEQTVKNQLSVLYDKVGVGNRLELALAAIHRRLLEG